MCKNRITGAPEDVESQLDMLKNIDNIPRLILCDSCQIEYDIPSWVLLKEKTPTKLDSTEIPLSYLMDN